MLSPGQEFTFTIKRGVGTADCVSVNYDDFVNDVDVGDMLLVDGRSNAFRSFYFLSNSYPLQSPSCYTVIRSIYATTNLTGKHSILCSLYFIFFCFMSSMCH